MRAMDVKKQIDMEIFKVDWLYTLIASLGFHIYTFLYENKKPKYYWKYTAVVSFSLNYQIATDV